MDNPHCVPSQAVIARSRVDPAAVGDITVGIVRSPSALHEARTAAIAAGFPETVPVQIISRFCSSGLMAVTDISNKIRVGQIDIGLAIGAESMTNKCVLDFAHSSKSLS